MTAQLLKSSPGPAPEPNGGGQPRASRLAWACLPLMLALSAGVLLLLGVSWWTALVVVLLLACPAAMAVATHVGFRPISGLPRPRSRRPNAP